MPQITTQAKLRQLYPTLEALEKARKNYPSWRQMAKALGMHPQSLADYRKVAGAVKAKPEKKKDILLITPAEIDKGIKELIGDDSTNLVTTYKITDPEKFYANPCGNEGLELARVECGTAFHREWRDWSVDG